jgi:hypothetical protein
MRRLYYYKNFLVSADDEADVDRYLYGELGPDVERIHEILEVPGDRIVHKRISGLDELPPYWADFCTHPGVAGGISYYVISAHPQVWAQTEVGVICRNYSHV